MRRPGVFCYRTVQVQQALRVAGQDLLAFGPGAGQALNEVLLTPPIQAIGLPE